MVDYSKWDKLEASDEEEERPSKPQVRRFEGPQTVTIGGDRSGDVLVAPQAAADEDVEEVGDEPMEPPEDEELDMEGDLREDVLQLRGLAERALQKGDAAEGVRLLERAMRLGGEHCPGLADVLESARRQAAPAPSTAAEAASAGKRSHGDEEQKAMERGGMVEDRYCWSQTKETVDVSVFVPAATKAKDVKVRVADDKVSIFAGNSAVLQGDWEFKVVPEEDPDWELLDRDGQRAIRLTVRKAPVPGGFSVVVWWKRVLKGDPAIDLSSIGDRKTDSVEKFAKVWEEAHAQFRQKVKDRQPINLDEDIEVDESRPGATAPMAV
mmetsp:Transcript_40173/g.87783  ORF Transcript_40173/g.87783 Transcript_40173/m.87783 type:complete len:324 (+) Transcript_40173:155-1126(+)